MSKCYLCDEILYGENISIEHVIPNSIGGRLKSNELLCKKCNSLSGQLWDGAFSRLGNILASKYDIKREKGIVPNFIAYEIETKKKLIISSGSKAQFYDPENIWDGEFNIISAPNRTRLLQEIEKLKKNWAKENIKMEVLEISEKLVNENRNFEHEIILEPDIYLRAICKIMINYYLLKTKDLNSLENIIQFLRSESENQFCWFLNLNLSQTFHDKKPYHIIIIKGESKSKALYGYFEMFGETGFITLLNGRYLGSDIQLNYTYDPIEIKEVIFNYNFKLSVSDIISLIHQKSGLEYYQVI